MSTTTAGPRVRRCKHTGKVYLGQLSWDGHKSGCKIHRDGGRDD